MKVVITGGGGFIGSRLVAVGYDRDYEMIVHSGPPGCFPPEAGLQFDIEDLHSLRSAFDGADTVVHLAGPSSVADSFEVPLEYVRSHTVGTTSVIEACRACSIRRLILVSSAEVYGCTSVSLVSEGHPLDPRSPYAAAKLGAESVVRAAFNSGVLECAVIFRPFSVYGEGMRRASIVGKLLDQALRKQRLQVFDTRPVRDYVYVEDVAQAIWYGVDQLTKGLSTLNICTGVGTSVHDLGEQVADTASLSEGAVSAKGSDRPTAADIMHLVGDPARMTRSTGWSATVDLGTGLARMLKAREG